MTTPTITKTTEPRLISREVQKAETKLLQLRRLKQKSLEHHAIVWDEKRATFIDSMDPDVRRMLVAGGVITEAEVIDATGQ